MTPIQDKAEALVEKYVQNFVKNSKPTRFLKKELGKYEQAVFFRISA